ncbi:unnamed protein product [Ilex paraguariensis]|uniref:Uncharacterized protein n=1 Tax=Ilex paraguariensis TaxID=185542 RepID=A0ABC8U0P1_9AQUA
MGMSLGCVGMVGNVGLGRSGNFCRGGSSGTSSFGKVGTMGNIGISGSSGFGSSSGSGSSSFGKVGIYGNGGSSTLGSGGSSGFGISGTVVAKRWRASVVILSLFIEDNMRTRSIKRKGWCGNEQLMKDVVWQKGLAH